MILDEVDAWHDLPTRFRLSSLDSRGKQYANDMIVGYALGYRPCHARRIEK